MNKRFGLLALFFFALPVTSASVWGHASLQSFTVTSSGGVFTSIGTQGTSGANTVWPVTVDLGLLGTLPPSVMVNFPDRAAATLIRDRSEPRGPNTFLWTARGNGCSAMFSAATSAFRGVISALTRHTGWTS